MKRHGASIAGIVFLGFATIASAQQRLPPLPPPPVSLEVPHPIPPVPTSPSQDLYQRPLPLWPSQPTWFPFRANVFPPFGYSVPFGYSIPLDYTLPFGYTMGPLPFGFFPLIEHRTDSYSAPLAYSLPAGTLIESPVASGTGWMRFETSPFEAQIFVDGVYAGVVSDFGLSGSVLSLQAGSHQIELRAPGFSSAVFNVSIVPGEITRYRGDLQRITPRPAPPPAPAPARSAAPKPTYVIPNCYAGDRKPVLPLPAGCSAKGIQTRR